MRPIHGLILLALLVLLPVPACNSAAEPPASSTAETLLLPTTGEENVMPPTIVPSAKEESEPVPYYQKAGKYIDIIISGGVPRWFMMHIPESYQHGTPTPLVLNYHGAGSNFEQQELISGMSEKAEEEGFIAVYPKAIGGSWTLATGLSGDIDINFSKDLIAYLEGKLSIDRSRIYATGFSNGGGLVDNLGCILADKIAAIAPIAGSYVYWIKCEPARPIPVISFHGTEDSAVAYQGGGFSMPGWAANWAERNGCEQQSIISYQQGDVIGDTWGNCDENATVTLYTIAGGEHVWPGSALGAGPRSVDAYPRGIIATDIIWEFFEEHPMP